MDEFEIQYRIENKYENQVRKANFQLLVIPESSKEQKVSDIKFATSGGQEIHISKNIFGFKTINYYIDTPFSEFWFNLSAKIEKAELNPYVVSPWTSIVEYEKIQSLDFFIDNALFLRATNLTSFPLGAEFLFAGYSKEIQVFDFLIELNSYIFKLLTYAPESTDINTRIEKVLELKRGVCQDYAHLFISVCRKNKIPARYVSGYLNQGADFIGTSQLHAWVEALVPGLGWVGFDSTNNLLVDHHYLKIAHGTDYRDCSPIIGVLESTGEQRSIHSVTVTNQ
jgi:transglutaminase-like putative cysteine protease